MAKVPFSKLCLKINTDTKILSMGDLDIEIKQYLPVNEKLELIGKVINQSADGNNFANPIKLEVFGALEIIFAYTNISFTEKQKEDLIKLYDMLNSNDIINKIVALIPEEEYCEVIEGIQDCADAIYTYRSSVMGIIDSINQDYSMLDLDATSIQKKIADPQNLELLRTVLTKLG